MKHLVRKENDMTKKERSAQVVEENEMIFRCPICHQSVRVVERKSLICTNGHTFDFAKQGYVNVLTKQPNEQYDEPLFEARQQMIQDSQLYASLHHEIARIIQQYIDKSVAPVILLDAGSGEGSHLQKIIAESKEQTITGIGLDIAKEGILKAAKSYEEPIWLVGDLANIPMADHTCDVIFNMLSPANYDEFNRILAPGGIVVKIVPRAHYLQELREVLFANVQKQTYSNADTRALFTRHFALVDCIPFQHTQTLTESEMRNLIRMSPLGWNANQQQINAFLQRDCPTITIDVEILIGVKQ